MLPSQKNKINAGVVSATQLTVLNQSSTMNISNQQNGPTGPTYCQAAPESACPAMISK